MDALMAMIEKFCLLEELYAEREKQGIPTPAGAMTVSIPASVPSQKFAQSQPAPKKQVNTVKSSSSKRVPKPHD